MKTFSSLAFLACLVYQAVAVPVATTSDVEKREAAAAPLAYGMVKRDEAETEIPSALYYFYGKRVAEEAEDPSPLYYFYGKREEGEGDTSNAFYYFYGKHDEAETEIPSALYYFYGKREETEEANPAALYYFYGKRDETEEADSLLFIISTESVMRPRHPLLSTYFMASALLPYRDITGVRRPGAMILGLFLLLGPK